MKFTISVTLGNDAMLTQDDVAESLERTAKKIRDYANPPAAGEGGRVIDRNGRRDPRLDAYLAAHRQFQGGPALGPGTGFMRSAAYEVGPQR